MRFLKYSSIPVLLGAIVLIGFSPAPKPIINIDNITLSSPVPGALISSSFGERQHPVTKLIHVHGGIDLVAPAGTAVLAAADGVVEFATAEFKGGEVYGTVILIRHNELLHTFYAHLQDIDVVSGQEVTQGQSIGTVGATGRTSGAHLHFEVLKSEDPKNYISDW